MHLVHEMPYLWCDAKLAYSSNTDMIYPLHSTHTNKWVIRAGKFKFQHRFIRNWRQISSSPPLHQISYALGRESFLVAHTAVSLNPVHCPVSTWVGGCQILEDAQRLSCRMVHRGATGHDNDSGDGSGILTAIPDTFYREICRSAQSL